MSEGLWMRVVLSLILAGVLTFFIYSCQSRESVVRSETDDRHRYMNYGFGMMLPVLVVLYLGIGIWKLGLEQTLKQFIPLLLSVCLHLCVYYLLLILFLPCIRKFISARVSAALWVLPNGIYFLHDISMKYAEPLLVLQLPAWVQSYGFYLWGIGFSAVLLQKIILHFCFRYQILRGSYDVTCPEVLAIWEKERKNAGYTRENGYKKLPYRLVYSPAIRTPLSIGFFRGSIRVVLPERKYTPEDLTLILRHELIHIGREDAKNKFFLVFCTAMCWFNPLMWIVNRLCADDLELSCDETVLLNEDTAARYRYAELLLQTVGDDRGFTTCLSTSAKALRYRLKNIMNPSKKWVGGVFAGAIFFLLLITYGCVGFCIK